MVSAGIDNAGKLGMLLEHLSQPLAKGCGVMNAASDLMIDQHYGDPVQNVFEVCKKILLGCVR
jgi:hypothetical protein